MAETKTVTPVDRTKFVKLIGIALLVLAAILALVNFNAKNAALDENAALNAKVEELTASVAAVQAELDAKTAEAETLTADVTDKTAQIDALTAEAADKAAQIEALTAEAAEAA